MVGKGHFDQLPPTGPSVGCRFGQGTFAGATRNGQDAPIPAVRRHLIEPLESDPKATFGDAALTGSANGSTFRVT